MLSSNSAGVKASAGFALQSLLGPAPVGSELEQNPVRFAPPCPPTPNCAARNDPPACRPHRPSPRALHTPCPLGIRPLCSTTQPVAPRPHRPPPPPRPGGGAPRAAGAAGSERGPSGGRAGGAGGADPQAGGRACLAGLRPRGQEAPRAQGAVRDSRHPPCAAAAAAAAAAAVGFRTLPSNVDS